MSHVKRGFTLVELLVVIAIIGVLVALLLPAVQAAREAARRSSCSNNLKQISLGVHNYADVYVSAYPVGEYACCWGTWLVGLLPYIEQKPMFDKYQYFGSVQNQAGNNYAQTDTATRYGGALNLPVTRLRVSTYTCPSDVVTFNTTGASFHNYVGNHGNTSLNRTTPLGTRLDGTPNVYGGAPFIVVGAWNANPQIMRLQDVLDGTSNTLLFSELVQGKQNDLRGFAWWNGGSHFETQYPPNSSIPDSVESNCVPANPLNPPCVVQTAVTNPTSIAARSRHPGGVQASLCDGSVRFISNTINLDTWRWLSTAYGRETLANF
jgi:prepilin-type N-terminal cleavage/methylation domain-containing protein